MASLQRRKIKGKYYWYIVESKRIQGKPTPVVVAYLGTVDNILNKLSSNQNSVFLCKSYIHGFYSLWKIAEKYGIIAAADSVIKERKRNGITKGQLLVLNAIYRITCNDEAKDIAEWLSGSTLPEYLKLDAEKLTNNYFQTNAEKFSVKEIEEIENQILKIMPKKLLAETNTPELTFGNFFNFSTISNITHTSQKKISSVSGGKVKQYSIGVISARDINLPLISWINEGNLNNSKQHIKSYAKFLDEVKSTLQSNSLTIILDKSNITKDILNDINNSKYNFICSIPVSVYKDISHIPLDMYKLLNINGMPIKCYRTQRTVFGNKYEFLVYFNQRDKDAQIRKLNRDINERLEKLEYLKSQILNPTSKFSTKRLDVENMVKAIIGKNLPDGIINVTFVGKQKIKDIKFEVCEQIYKELCSLYAGKKLLITNHKNWPSEDILCSYFLQTDIDRSFRSRRKLWSFSIRDDINWTFDKVKIHVFCCLLGLTLLELLRMDLQKQGINVTSDQLLDILRDIRQVTIFRPNGEIKTDFDLEKANGNFIKVIEEMNEYKKMVWNTITRIIDTDEIKETQAQSPGS